MQLTCSALLQKNGESMLSPHNRSITGYTDFIVLAAQNDCGVPKILVSTQPSSVNIRP